MAGCSKSAKLIPWIGIVAGFVSICALVINVNNGRAQGFDQRDQWFDGRGQGFGTRDPYCAKLEQELAQIWVRRNQPNLNLPKLRSDLRQARKQLRRAEIRAERADCYESLLFFGTSLRRTRKCIRLDREIQKVRRDVSRLELRLNSETDSFSNNNERDRIIDALARNGCGVQYQQEARRRSGNFFDELFGGGNDYYNPSPRYDGRQSNHILPYATYRTMCVRKCDGFYYPVSFSALSSKFIEDADQCVSNCAAPAELFIYRNPGEEVEHMVSLDGVPYSELPNAWKYRREFVKGCSCKQAEYSPVPEKLEEIEGGSKKQSQNPRQLPRNQTATVNGRNEAVQSTPGR